MKGVYSLYIHCNTKDLENQILSDKDNTGKERPWQEFKAKTITLSESLKRIGMIKKASRLLECATFLEFKRNIGSGILKLNTANFCKYRLCQMCAWRRGKKVYSQFRKVISKALELKEYKFIFLTLTCKNVYGEELENSLNNMFHAFKKFAKRKQIQKCVKGFYRVLEVTHNINKNSISYDTYHPHFHIILMVNKSYFTDKDLYLSHEKFRNLWKESLQVDYDPQVNVKVFRTSNKEQIVKSICEVAKYPLKDNNYIIPDDIEMTDSAVMILDKALENRRLIAYGGELKKIHKSLNLDDAEEGDLIKTGTEEEEPKEGIDFVIERYRWKFGYNQYYKMD